MTQEWIPVETELPDGYLDVLISVHHPHRNLLHDTVELGFIEEGEWFIITEAGVKDVESCGMTVKGWMKKPLPMEPICSPSDNLDRVNPIQ
jgi:hypothetical protein